MNEELQPKWYEDIKLSELKNIIKDNIGIAGRSFVTIGYYLKNIRDRELYLEDGYQNIWEFAQSEFGIGKSSASQFMSINDKFSRDGNSPLLLDQYKDFTSSKLAEMLTLSDEQLEQITPTTTIAKIREIKKPVKEVKTVLTSEQGSECFVRDQINDTGEDGLRCSGGISEECSVCDKAESDELKLIDDLDFTVRTYNCLKRANINTINELCDLTEDKVIAIRNISRKCLDEINEKLSGIGKRLKQDYQLPDCIHEAGTECNMINIKPIAESLGADCNGKCCWGCKELCGARCNASIRRPDVNNEPEIVDSAPGIVNDVDETEECIDCKLNGNTEAGIMECHPERGDHKCWSGDDEDLMEIVEAEIVQTEPEELPKPVFSAMYHLTEAIKREEEQVETMRDYWKVNQPDSLLKHETVLLALKLHLTDMKYPNPEPVEIVQPVLPILKNNDQRKEFIEAYETWPIWIDQKETGERYYRYNLTDKVSMVVKVSKKHHHESWKETKDYEYGAEQYYLLGIKSEWTSKGNTVVEDDTRTFYECNTNKSALVDYLKEFQKK